MTSLISSTLESNNYQFYITVKIGNRRINLEDTNYVTTVNIPHVRGAGEQIYRY